jgi:hypothetical protein
MAQGRRNKPVPKTQSELTREQLTPYDGRGAAPNSSKGKRETQISLKDDTVKLPVVGFKDIDEAIIYYFNNVIKPSVIQNGSKIDVPVLYGSPERWAAVQKDGFYRDKDGKIQVPLMMFKKSNIEKNRTLGNKLDGNEVTNFVIYEKKYSKRNIYDRFSIVSNRNPSQELYGVVIPDYVTITYQCVIFTDYVEQCDKLIEALNFASDSYWGDKDRYRFRAMIDSYAPTVEVVQGQDRAVKATFNIKLNGYIITDTYNRDKANLKKFYSKAQVNFKMETAGTIEELTARAATPESSTPVRFYDTATVTGGGTYALSTEDITYLTLKNAAIANSKSSSSATFTSRTIATAPAGYPSPGVQDFEVYINGRRVPASQVTSVSQVGADIIVVLDVAGFFEEPGAVLAGTDEILLIGKFS